MCPIISSSCGGGGAQGKNREQRDFKMKGRDDDRWMQMFLLSGEQQLMSGHEIKLVHLWLDACHSASPFLLQRSLVTSSLSGSLSQGQESFLHRRRPSSQSRTAGETQGTQGQPVTPSSHKEGWPFPERTGPKVKGAEGGGVKVHTIFQGDRGNNLLLQTLLRTRK